MSEKLKPCPVMGLSPLFAGVASVCRDCPNRAPSAVERELRECLEEMIRIYSCGATSKEIIKVAQNALLAKKGSDRE
jgi:hypothetical protein